MLGIDEWKREEAIKYNLQDLTVIAAMDDMWKLILPMITTLEKKSPAEWTELGVQIFRQATAAALRTTVVKPLADISVIGVGEGWRLFPRQSEPSGLYMKLLCIQRRLCYKQEICSDSTNYIYICVCESIMHNFREYMNKKNTTLRSGRWTNARKESTSKEKRHTVIHQSMRHSNKIRLKNI